MLNELENPCNSLLPLTTSMPCQIKRKKYEKNRVIFLITTWSIKVAKCQKIYNVRAPKDIQATAYNGTHAYLLMFIIIQRVPAFSRFWDLKKTGLGKIPGSGTLEGPLLTRKSSSYVYISQKLYTFGENSVSGGLPVLWTFTWIFAWIFVLLWFIHSISACSRP